jgi:hypothetical protein
MTIGGISGSDSRVPYSKPGIFMIFGAKNTPQPRQRHAGEPTLGTTLPCTFGALD